MQAMKSLIDEAASVDSIKGEAVELNKLDIDFYFREAAKQRGAPAEFVKSKRVIAEEEAAKAEQQQTQQIVQGAPQLAQAAKGFAEAEAISRQG